MGLGVPYMGFIRVPLKVWGFEVEGLGLRV